jgi:hypothetical protein
VWLEGFRKLKKNAMTLSGIELATFRFVASYLNQLRYRVPYIIHYSRIHKQMLSIITE